MTTVDTEDGTVGAVKLYHIPTASLVVELVNILCDKTAQSPGSLPSSEAEVVDVRQEAGPARPANKVPGPVALSGGPAFQEHFVLDRSLAGGGVQSNTLASVIRDTTLSRDT